MLTACPGSTAAVWSIDHLVGSVGGFDSASSHAWAVESTSFFSASLGGHARLLTFTESGYRV